MIKTSGGWATLPMKPCRHAAFAAGSCAAGSASGMVPAIDEHGTARKFCTLFVDKIVRNEFDSGKAP